MTDPTILFYGVMVCLGVLTLLGIAGAILNALGFQLNEPEYYEHKRSRKQCK